MTDQPKRTEVLASLGLQKAPELASVRGQVAPKIQECLQAMAQESGIKEEAIVGLAITDWVKRAQRRLAKAKAEA
jgi:hypothetical protein